MTTYDYSNNTDTINEVTSQLDLMGPTELNQVRQSIEDIQRITKEERLQNAVSWFQNGILPALQNLAECTSSLLTIEEQKGSVFIATIKSLNGLDVSESCGYAKALLSMANHIGIDADGRDVVLTLIFDCTAFAS